MRLLPRPMVLQPSKSLLFKANAKALSRLPYEIQNYAKQANDLAAAVRSGGSSWRQKIERRGEDQINQDSKHADEPRGASRGCHQRCSER